MSSSSVAELLMPMVAARLLLMSSLSFSVLSGLSERTEETSRTPLKMRCGLSGSFVRANCNRLRPS